MMRTMNHLCLIAQITSQDNIVFIILAFLKPGQGVDWINTFKLLFLSLWFLFIWFLFICLITLVSNLCYGNILLLVRLIHWLQLSNLFFFYCTLRTYFLFWPDRFHVPVFLVLAERAYLFFKFLSLFPITKTFHALFMKA